MQLNQAKRQNATLIESLKIQLSLLFLHWNNSIIWLVSKLLFHSKIPANPKKMLIYRWGSIGDCICSLPAIHNIKIHYPNSIIDIENNCPDSNIPFMKLLLNYKYYQHIINSGRLPRNIYYSILKEKKYDIYFMLLGSKYSLIPILKRMLFIRLAGIKCMIGQEAKFVPFFRKTQAKFFNFETVTNNILNSLNKNGIPHSPPNQYPLNINEFDEKVVRQMISNIDSNKKNIALSIGGSADYKKWPIENYQAIADYLSPNFNVFVIGGKEDFEKGNQLKNVHNFCGKVTLMQSAVLMRFCILTVSNDTGPMHLSYAIGTPVIGLFSNWDFPNTWHPPKDEFNVALRAENIPCEVCLVEQCPNNNLCINEIEINSIKIEIEKILKGLHV